jgi:hypothetical protein
MFGMIFEVFWLREKNTSEYCIVQSVLGMQIKVVYCFSIVLVSYSCTKNETTKLGRETEVLLG